MAMQIVGRERRKFRIRRKISGSPERPRLTVFRSSKHIYAQVVDDQAGSTIAHASTLTREVRTAIEESTKSDAAKQVEIYKQQMHQIRENTHGQVISRRGGDHAGEIWDGHLGFPTGMDGTFKSVPRIIPLNHF